jgi:DNA-binding transcriptional ArsR family regulator
MSFTEPGEPGETAPALEPGSPGNAIEVTDPRAMRALAHPARIAILQRLVIDGPATATECAETAMLSPSACSYHLRALARHGFVEEDADSAADGRHRPWRARMVTVSFSSRPDQPEAVKSAGRLLAEIVQARTEEVRHEYLERQADYPPQWRSAATQHNDVLHVTPDELAEVTSRLAAVLSEYRRLDAAERPAGSRRVQAVFDLTPWFRPDGES